MAHHRAARQPRSLVPMTGGATLAASTVVLLYSAGTGVAAASESDDTTSASSPTVAYDSVEHSVDTDQTDSSQAGAGRGYGYRRAIDAGCSYSSGLLGALGLSPSTCVAASPHVAGSSDQDADMSQPDTANRDQTVGQTPPASQQTYYSVPAAPTRPETGPAAAPSSIDSPPPPGQTRTIDVPNQTR